MRPFSTRSTVVPVKRIVLPVPSGSEPGVLVGRVEVVGQRGQGGAGGVAETGDDDPVDAAEAGGVVDDHCAAKGEPGRHDPGPACRAPPNQRAGRGGREIGCGRISRAGPVPTHAAGPHNLAGGVVVLGMSALPSFASLVDEHGAAVFGLLVALVGRQDAEDCWQETYLAALTAYAFEGIMTLRHKELT